jgi:hypothetical protein
VSVKEAVFPFNKFREFDARPRDAAVRARAAPAPPAVPA